MRVVVSRKTWLRGEGKADSRLHRQFDGKRCCWGFWAQQNGFSDDQLGELGAIRLLGIEDPRLACFLAEPSENGRRYEADWIFDAYDLNDARDISDAEREAKLTTLFAANGHEIVFED